MGNIEIIRGCVGHQTKDVTLDSSVPDIHVWIFELMHDHDTCEKSVPTLSEEESSKANRFRFAADRSYFIAAHETIRHVLSLYLNCLSHEIQFVYGRQGKPQLKNNLTDLRFNHSRSNGLAVLAVTRGREIGVDIEFIKNIEHIDQIAVDFFAASEASEIRELPRHQLLEAFFACWTRKEAFSKAVGRGLHMPLDSFAVSVSPIDSPQLAFVKDYPQEANSWRILDIEVRPGWRAALCFQIGPSSLVGLFG